uniref:Uncharacterized protein n=1 Tax=Glossina morsitans morsitans TaxID=37546 RepID=A0A1A9YUJ1_GLOMM
MAPLRKDRCANMFRTIGVDFDGYVNVFVCCCTKAIHLKLCSEISTSTFVAAFVGGKGFPHRINVAKEISQMYFIHKFSSSYTLHGRAAVKSFKYRSRKLASNIKFTFDEFTTLIVRVETLLYFPKLPFDLTALTPDHFQHAPPLLAIAEIAAEDLSMLNRWERVKTTPSANLNEGSLVVIMNENLPPNEWHLGRTVNGSGQGIRVTWIKWS